MRPVLFSALLLALLGSHPARADVAGPRATYAALMREEARKAGLPFDVADAVMAIESGYDPTRIGGVGEVGLMQVLPSTAAMMGFRGTPAALADPATNIHYGVTYLAGAWRKADGDLCRALMKYRAGHGESVMTPLSVTYCERARAHLASLGSALAAGVAPRPDVGAPGRTARGARAPRLTGAAFWAAHTVRIARLNAAVERRWKRIAAR